MTTTEYLKTVLDMYSSRDRREVVDFSRMLVRRLYRDTLPDLSQLSEDQTRLLCELAMFYIER